MILVTGGAGFIGSHFVRDWLDEVGEPLLNLDALTYAGQRANLEGLPADGSHRFVEGDIRDRALLDALLAEHRPRAIVHLAAQTHVDRSIASPRDFVATNVCGTMELLEAARAHWSGLDVAARERFRFVHVSTDEVYGSLAPGEAPFVEGDAFEPSSPYSASKAAADHLLHAWHRTWGLPTISTHSTSNYGPRQYPEKLIPLMVTRALAGQTLPVYGDGSNSRDWLHVRDHCRALRRVLEAGRPGSAYNVGAGEERSNLEVVRAIIGLVDALVPDPAGPRARLIRHVADRPGHDRRYGLDTTRIRGELGWAPKERFEQGLAATVRWYVENPRWIERVSSDRFRAWVRDQYQRPGRVDD